MRTASSGEAMAPVARQKARARGWAVARRVLVAAGLTIVVLAGLAGGDAVLYVQRAQAETTGTLRVAGLQRPVSVLRDRWGVPHITANTLHDVAFAQGYVTAQDRLFQMVMNRRIAQGRLAEMFGPGPDHSLVDADAFLRTLNLYRSARIELVTLDPRIFTELQAYADGVNAFIATHTGSTALTTSLPPEFPLLGLTPEPWTPVDSLAYGRVVALSLDNQWQTKIARAAVLAKAGPAVTDLLFPPYPNENPTLLTRLGQAAPLDAAELGQDGAVGAPSDAMVAQAGAGATALSAVPVGAAEVQQLLGSISDALGSNDWVVDSTRTASGRPLLANDPHLGIGMPSIWYEVGLRGGGLDAIGFSFPGEPGVVIGHNNRIAWGVTNVGADNTDLYHETLDPTLHPGKYLYAGAWLPLVSRQETIRVRGAAAVTITVRETRHGPLLNDVSGDLKGAAPTALMWTALQPGYSFQGFFQLDFAQNWQEFQAALANISISQNFVYGDVDGNIGYRLSGILPLRSPDNALAPVDGSTPDHDWQGYVPQAQMPAIYNPPTHVIATANQQILPPSSVPYVTTWWDQGYRARRILDMLGASGPLTMADFQRIQADVTSLPAAQLTPLLLAAGGAPGADGDAAAGAALLNGWDFTMTRGSAAAAVFEVAAGNLARDLIEPALGKATYEIYRGGYSSSGIYSVLLRQLLTPAAPFFTGDAAAERDALVARALGEAVRQLRSRLGPNPASWRWGDLHQATFAHPLASVKPLDRLFGVAPVARPGDSVTVSVGGDGGFSNDPPEYAQHTVSSMREIIDLSALDHSLWVITTGQSGVPFSSHYDDLVPLWDGNQYQQMAYSAEAEAAAAVDILVLKP